MGEYWLVEKLFNDDDPADAFFAFLGSAHWMRALAMKSSKLVEDPMDVKQFYNQKNMSRCSNDVAIRSIENHYKALHFFAAVKSISLLREEAYNLIRPAIISWYYVLYFASKAFLRAKCGQDADKHRVVSKLLQDQVISKTLFIDPFDMNAPNIIEEEFEEHISQNYPCDRYILKDEPKTTDDAERALVAYLRGTKNYEQERTKEEVRRTKEFKALGVSDFKRKKAKEVRDKCFRKKPVNILVQAFRYRGKANYRDGLYLSYVKDNSNKICRLTEDMHYVAKAFMIMISAYLKSSVPQSLWDEYCDDITKHTRFDLDNELLMQT